MKRPQETRPTPKELDEVLIYDPNNGLLFWKWPPNEIDHINGDKIDNRLCNLREASKGQNQANRRTNITNPLGLKGVHFCKRNGKFSASLRKENKQHWLGYHETAPLAYRAYCDAAKKFHGEFARLA